MINANKVAFIKLRLLGATDGILDMIFLQEM